jgi:hypothetical protein
MRCILIGYPGSQRIVPASKYLTDKYLHLIVTDYINYTGNINCWAAFLSGYLSSMPDTNIIFALDDYLVANYLNAVTYYSAEREMGGDVVCVKLCQSTPEEHEEYPVTTQYCIWNREYLIWLLGQVTTPWSFEIDGSRWIKNTTAKVLHRPCIEYFANSSISKRWEGVRLDGLKDEDIKHIKENLL